MKCYIRLSDNAIKEITDVEYDSINGLVTFRYVGQHYLTRGVAERVFIVPDNFNLRGEYVEI